MNYCLVPLDCVHGYVSTSMRSRPVDFYDKFSSALDFFVSITGDLRLEAYNTTLS